MTLGRWYIARKWGKWGAPRLILSKSAQASVIDYHLTLWCIAGAGAKNHVISLDHFRLTKTKNEPPVYIVHEPCIPKTKEKK